MNPEPTESARNKRPEWGKRCPLLLIASRKMSFVVWPVDVRTIALMYEYGLIEPFHIKPKTNLQQDEWQDLKA